MHKLAAPPRRVTLPPPPTIWTCPTAEDEARDDATMAAMDRGEYVSQEAVCSSWGTLARPGRGQTSLVDIRPLRAIEPCAKRLRAPRSHVRTSYDRLNGDGTRWLAAKL